MLELLYQRTGNSLHGVVFAVFLLWKLLGKAMGIRFIGMAIHDLVLRSGRSAAGGVADGWVISQFTQNGIKRVDPLVEISMKRVSLPLSDVENYFR